MVTCRKTPTSVTRNEHLRICCRVIVTQQRHSRTIRSLVSQPSSAVKGADKSELQSHHCIFEQIKIVNHIRTAVHDHPNCL